MTGTRFAVGRFECLAVNDGWAHFNARSFFANAPEAELAPLLAEYGITGSTIPTPFHCLLIRTGSHTVLIETGLGAQNAPDTGHLLSGLRAGGVDPASVDTVILTHAHIDHIGGALDAAGNPAFPAARYVLSDAEWAFWFSPAAQPIRQTEAVRAILERLQPQIEQVATGASILPGITAVPAPGHTPGQIALRIESAGEHMLHVADVIAHPIHRRYPDWHIIADFDPAQAIRTRRALLANPTRIFVYHFPKAGEV